VSFTITDMTTNGLERRADAISSVTRSATGTNVSALARDVSTATDLISNIGAYDSTLISVTGTIASAFASSGTDFQAAEINTAGITGQSALTFRVPATLVDQLDMAPSCTVTATNVPFGRFKSTVELGSYTTADFMMPTCPAPAIASAVATSATTVTIAFTRRIDPTTFDANGDQFALDGGLTISAATLTARTITLTTSAQTAGTTYTLSFAGTPLKDLMGNAFVPPMTAPTLLGFTVQAGVLINELNAAVTGGCDLIELRVTSDGTMANFKITEREGVVASGELSFTFPSGFNVTKNSLVMVHLNSTSATCNKNAATQEVNTPTDQPVATFAGNYDTAYDFWVADTGLTATDNVITVYDGTGAIADAVLLTTTNTGAADSLGQGNIVAAASQWTPGPTANGMYAAADFSAAAVMGLGSTGPAVTGTATSIQRNADADTNAKADWVITAQTFGAINAGEAALPAKKSAKR
jgi:hypothetical protein